MIKGNDVIVGKMYGTRTVSFPGMKLLKALEHGWEGVICWRTFHFEPPVSEHGAKATINLDFPGMPWDGLHQRHGIRL